MFVGSAIIFFLVVTAGFTISGVIGFGANVLTLPILSIFFEISDLVVVLAVISFVNALYRVYENWQGILWRQFSKMLFISLPGTMIGLWLLTSLPEEWMKLILGIFVFIVAIYNLIYNKKAQTNEQLRKETWQQSLFYHIVLFIGGILQGAFVCGGPMYIIYCSHYYGHTRIQFRGMQFGIILVNSFYIFASYLIQGVYTKALVVQSLIGLGAFLLAVMISAVVLKYLKDNQLYKMIQIVLASSGISLIMQSSGNIFC